MSWKWLGPGLLVLVPTLAFLAAGPAVSQPAGKQTPRTSLKAEAVAETRLLMEALAHPNFRGLERILRQKPASTEAWSYARGQALLIAEAGNLLLLRPPRNSKAQSLWFTLATDLRSAGRDLAQNAAQRNFEASRAGFIRLANVCNRCHQGFRIPVEIVPFEEPAPKKQK
jgi:hypothetical protein